MQVLMTRELASDRLGVPSSHVDIMMVNGELTAINVAGATMLDLKQVACNSMARAIAPSLAHTYELLAKCMMGPTR